MRNTERVVYVFVCVALFAGFAKAQTPTPTASPDGMISIEGVSGDVDKKRREPVLSVRAAPGPESATIYADAYVVNDEFKKYPIQFDFYVNRSFFASQIRSVELPGPIGVTVSYKDAPIPFNYTVIAKILHPNRTFTTVLNASVESIEPTPQPGQTVVLDCTFTDKSSSSEVLYENAEVPTAESSGSISSSFTAANTSDSSDTVNLTFSGTESGSDLSGTLDIVKSSETSSKSVTGTFAQTDGVLTNFAVTTSDGVYSLECS